MLCASGPRLTHGERATVVLLFVQPRNSRLSLGVVPHFDEAKTLALAGVAILDDLSAYYRPELGKQLL
jgi:hypothetical protein